MDKLVKFKKNIPLFLFSLLTLKSIVFGAQFQDAVVLISSAALAAYFYYFEKNEEEPVNNVIKKDLEAFRETLREQKSAIDTLKISSSFRR